ncbi:MAG: Na+/H+ antiporter NhaA, partial [Pyrinomonadaceae bacterium]
MSVVQRKLSNSFKAFFDSERSSGIVLIICTLISLALANSALGESYLGMWQMYLGGLSIEHWINDALMAVFFLLIGLELE